MFRSFVRAALMSLGLIAAIPASTSFAQIIFEPYRYQYEVGGTYYYYGGSDPRVHAAAAGIRSAGGTFGRVNGAAFAAAGIRSGREVYSEPERVFTDSYGYGLRDAHWLGFTASDAHNEALANLPRYFVKRDLINAGVVVTDGSLIVPAAAMPIRIFNSDGTEVRTMPSTTRATSTRLPAPMPKPLFIIPRESLPKLAPPGGASDKQVASAG